VTFVGVAAVCAFLVGLVVWLGASGRIGEAYDSFVDDSPPAVEQQRDRLVNFAGHGRVDLWRTALESFNDAPVIGTGAGTFELSWEANPDRPIVATDAHSLALETLSELGMVGLALLALTLAAMAIAIGRAISGPDRALFAATAGASLGWLLQASIDWSWEMPAVTVWLFFAGGAALGASSLSQASRFPIAAALRVPLVLLIVAVALLPAQVALSQRELDQSRTSFAARDCPSAVNSALSSISILGERPEPYAVLGYCDARLGQPALGAEMMRRAIARDPNEWEYHYGLALLQAVSGDDPRPQAAIARRLNPEEPLAQRSVEMFSHSPMRRWPRLASAMTIPGTSG
jgi:hypothetical protein